MVAGWAAGLEVDWVVARAAAMEEAEVGEQGAGSGVGWAAVEGAVPAAVEGAVPAAEMAEAAAEGWEASVAAACPQPIGRTAAAAAEQGRSPCMCTARRQRTAGSRCP